MINKKILFVTATLWSLGCGLLGFSAGAAPDVYKLTAGFSIFACAAEGTPPNCGFPSGDASPKVISISMSHCQTDAGITTCTGNWNEVYAVDGFSFSAKIEVSKITEANTPIKYQITGSIRNPSTTRVSSSVASTTSVPQLAYQLNLTADTWLPSPTGKTAYIPLLQMD